MGFIKGKYNTALVRDLKSSDRETEIIALEETRDEINREIEALLVTYRKLTGKKKATKGAKKIGKSKKDYSYWQKYYD